MPPHQDCKSHLPRATRTTSSTRPPRKQFPLGDLCHLTGPPVSPPQAIRAASPGLRAPRPSGRIRASRLRVNPRLQEQPSWRVEPGSGQRPDTNSVSQTAGRSATATSFPRLFGFFLFSQRGPVVAAAGLRGGAPCRQGPGRPLRNWAQPRMVSGERGRSFPAPVKPPPAHWGS